MASNDAGGVAGRTHQPKRAREGLLVARMRPLTCAVQRVERAAERGRKRRISARPVGPTEPVVHPQPQGLELRHHGRRPLRLAHQARPEAERRSDGRAHALTSLPPSPRLCRHTKPLGGRGRGRPCSAGRRAERPMPAATCALSAMSTQSAGAASRHPTKMGRNDDHALVRGTSSGSHRAFRGRRARRGSSITFSCGCRPHGSLR